MRTTLPLFGVDFCAVGARAKRAASWSLGLSVALGVVLGCEPGEGPPDGRLVEFDGGRTCGTPNSVPAGHPCVCTSDCAGDALDCQPEAAFGFPGGVCADPCASDAECEPGNVCLLFPITIEGFRGTCMPACVTNADCPAWRTCGVFESRTYCYPLCQRDEDCRSGFCDEYSGNCTEGPPPSTGLGHLGLCTRHDECRSGSCVEGACTSICSLERDGCPDGTFCSVYEEGDLGLCGPPCSVNDDCDAYPSAVCNESYHPADVGQCVHTSDDVSDPCVSGTFVDAIAASAGCNGPFIGPNVPDNQFGGHCTMSPDSCEAPNFCHDGVCLQRCVRGDSPVVTSTCPAGSRCWFLDGGTCYPDCDDDTDCEGGSCDVFHSCD